MRRPQAAQGPTSSTRPAPQAGQALPGASRSTSTIVLSIFIQRGQLVRPARCETDFVYRVSQP